MNFSQDPDQELFRSLLVNDLNDISVILPKTIDSGLKCDHCDELFPDIADRKKHELIHYSFKCNKCFIVFTSKVSLGAHVLSSHNDQIQKVKKKDLMAPINVKQELTVKKKIKPPTKNIKQELTVKSEMTDEIEITRRDPTIRSRLARMLTMRSKLWHCDYEDCDRSFKDKGHALDHVETHVDYLVYPCKTPGCDRTFNSWTKLRSHNKINGGCRGTFL